MLKCLLPFRMPVNSKLLPQTIYLVTLKYEFLIMQENEAQINNLVIGYVDSKYEVVDNM